MSQNQSKLRDNTDRLLENLKKDTVYEHAIENINIVETHISWVILTGKYAYKIKKPVNLGFLDFSTLEKRHHFCLEELRLNKRLAADIYLEVVPITGSYDKPSVNGTGTAFEWAVKMLQFDSELQFDRLIDRGALQYPHIESLAKCIISFHNSLPLSNEDSRYGDARSTHGPVRENYRQASQFSASAAITTRLECLLRWHDEQFTIHESLLNKRKKNGFVRECHGDLHLGNITLYNDNVLIFDCLEFNENLRYIDVINEISFLLMDLEAHNYTEMADHFINDWLQECGDFNSLRLLTYYKVYRAMVRAKVAIIEASQKQGKQQAIASKRADHYLSLADRYSRQAKGAIILTHGLSGSGKTTISRQLARHIHAVYVRSDVERKRLFSTSDKDIYSEHASQETYHRLELACKDIVAAGYNALIDATFLSLDKREDFILLAKQLHIPCIILDFFAPKELLEKWLNERAAKGDDASDANITILNQQIKNQQPLTDYEKSISIPINTSQTIDIQSLAKKINSAKQ